MTEIVRNRTIRPSTRGDKSESYKINTETVTRGDTLVVNIDHESRPYRKTFRFNGSDVADRKSIHFKVIDKGSTIDIIWSGATPIGTSAPNQKPIKPKSLTIKSMDKAVSKPASTNTKTSFDPISNSDMTILILGTMPGDKSLKFGEYYGHPRNRFWRIIATITNNDLPITYSDKKQLLLKMKIGIWDVAHKVNRKVALTMQSRMKNLTT